jgi:hypothetical protein
MSFRIRIAEDNISFSKRIKEDAKGLSAKESKRILRCHSG